MNNNFGPTKARSLDLDTTCRSYISNDVNIGDCVFYYSKLLSTYQVMNENTCLVCKDKLLLYTPSIKTAECISTHSGHAIVLNEAREGSEEEFCEKIGKFNYNLNFRKLFINFLFQIKTSWSCYFSDLDKPRS